MTLVIEGSVAVATAVAGVYLRECSGHMSSWLHSCGSCCGGSPTRRKKLPFDPNASGREEFERLIGFLAAVPLFQKQLPRSELPRLAMAMRLRTFKPGEKVISQGDEGKEFFVIRAGEASVMVADIWGEETERAKLYHADYFGGRTLVEKRLNFATIYCKGPKPLETLSLTREEFERLGLHKMLKFPARPAIYEGRKIEDGQRMAPDPGALAEVSPSSRSGTQAPLQEEDHSLIVKSITDNLNLRARGDFDKEAVVELAHSARRRFVKKGDDLVKGGEVSHAFFVVSSGVFDIILAAPSSGHRSVEARLATKNVHERLARKQQFLMGVMRKDASTGRASGVRGGSKGSEPDDESAKAAIAKRKRATSLIGAGAAVDTKLKKAVEAKASPKTGKKTRHVSLHVPTALRDGAQPDLSLDNPFQVGDRVARVSESEGRLIRKVGTVREIVEPGEEGEVLVEFPEGSVIINVLFLRPTEERSSIGELGRGDCIGELALLYNIRQIAIYKAKEDAEVFVMEASAFKECFSRENNQMRNCIKLLDEVHMLTPLLRAERAELARCSSGLLTFKPGETVVSAGDIDQLWYVIESGSCTMEVDGRKEVLERAGHFGEKEIFKNMATSACTVIAGESGLSCVVFDGEHLRNLKSLEVDQEGNAGDYTPAQPRTKNHSNIRLDQLSIVAVLGEGGFGSVFLARSEGREYALKRLSKGYIVEQNMVKQICAERDILSMIDSPFIIRFFRSFKDTQYLYMLIEYATGGQLYTLMTDRSYILEQDEPRGSASMFYVACVTLALEHMHERNIVYRDLKPENILLDGAGFAKICDLGFARFVLDKTNTMVGTPEYMAPEMIDSPHAHDFRVDWWALGVLAFELLAGQVPFDSPEDDDDNVMIKLLTIRKEQDAGINEKMLPPGVLLAKDFIKKLLVVNEDQRLGASGSTGIKKHAWFSYAGFDFQALMAQKGPTPYSSSKKVVERVVKDAGLASAMSDELKSAELFVEYNGTDPSW
eukprot:CAMPEP_0206546112 /NCGR_PEP_ID=MMETSP0325_2-20121206/12516_1 /ASSEMBLY_ACC=CAM_ASM_000347 /TAXON_ID=2866 /ORGANISM="Crypthecodinium cohnii, Strain Seligo" /LENGTH=999 /DNA_ID=CAMNT_0054045183 /DNA_START=61 /DNA_END=3057 /DNA_ORIENTATION=-